jgi:WD40 repeat protein
MMDAPATRRIVGLSVTKFLNLVVIVFLMNLHPALAMDTPTLLVKYGIGALHCAILTPDESQLVTGGADGSVHFWSVSNNQLLRTLPCHTQTVNAIALSGDGRQMLTGCMDGMVRLWDVASGRMLLTLQCSDLSPVYAVAFAPDGKTFLTSYGGDAEVWDASSGKLLRIIGSVISSAKPAPARDRKMGKLYPDIFFSSSAAYNGIICAFSPDSRQIAVKNYGGHYVYTLDTVTGQRLHTFATSSKDNNKSLAFSSDGQKLLTCNESDLTVHLWDVTSGQLLRNFTAPPNCYPDDAALSPDGKRVVAISVKTILVWDAATGQLLRQWPAHTDQIYSISYSTDGKRLMTYGQDQTVKIWDAASGQPLRTLTGHVGEIVYPNAIALSHDGQRVLTGHADKTARLWDAKNGRLLRTLTGYDQYVKFVGFSSDDKKLLTSDWVQARVSAAETGQTLRANKFTTSGLSISAMAIAPSGKQVLAGCWASTGSTAQLLDLETGKIVLTYPGFDAYDAPNVNYTTDGKGMILVGRERNNSSTILRLQVIYGSTGSGRYDCGWAIPYSMDISTNGKKMILGSQDSRVRLYNIGNLKPVLTWDVPFDIYDVALAPDGQRALIAGNDYEVLLWNPMSTHVIARLPHPCSTVAAMFSADNKFALTGCWDGVARLWDVRNGAREWGRYQ